MILLDGQELFSYKLPLQALYEGKYFLHPSGILSSFHSLQEIQALKKYSFLQLEGRSLYNLLYKFE